MWRAAIVSASILRGRASSVVLRRTARAVGEAHQDRHIGSVFDAVMSLVEGGEHVIPSEDNVEKFIDWVHAHDLYQVSDLATDILRDQEAENGESTATSDLRNLPRDLILQLRANPNVSLGSGYRAYPGYSVAQVRRQFGIGW